MPHELLQTHEQIIHRGEIHTKQQRVAPARAAADAVVFGHHALVAPQVKHNVAGHKRLVKREELGVGAELGHADGREEPHRVDREHLGGLRGLQAVGVGERAGLLPRAEQRAQRPVVSRAAVVEAPARRVVEADALGRRQRGAGAVLAVELAGRRACALNVARDPRRHANLRSRGRCFALYTGARGGRGVCCLGVCNA